MAAIGHTYLKKSAAFSCRFLYVRGGHISRSYFNRKTHQILNIEIEIKNQKSIQTLNKKSN